MEPVKGGYDSNAYYYKSPKDENLIERFHPLFENLQSSEKVISYINEHGISHDSMVMINNHLSSSNSWSSVVDWTIGVEYTIEHPEGDILVSDNEHETEGKSFRREIISSFDANVYPVQDYILHMKRVSIKPIKELNYHSKKYKHVRISRCKRFIYHTSRSSFIFKLEICWKGECKESTEASDPTYLFSLETDDSIRVTKDPRYSFVSFIEKCLDIVSLGKECRQILKLK